MINIFAVVAVPRSSPTLFVLTTMKKNTICFYRRRNGMSLIMDDVASPPASNKHERLLGTVRWDVLETIVTGTRELINVDCGRRVTSNTVVVFSAPEQQLRNITGNTNDDYSKTDSFRRFQRLILEYVGPGVGAVVFVVGVSGDWYLCGGRGFSTLQCFIRVRNPSWCTVHTYPDSRVLAYAS